MQHNKWAAHAAVVILLFAAAAFGAGQVSVMDPITKLPKYLKGGEGISINGASGIITATGTAVIAGSIPFENISSGVRGKYLGVNGTSNDTNAYKGNSAPSATEFSYLDNVTSPIQSQFSSGRAYTNQWATAFSAYTSVDRPPRDEVATAAQGAKADTALQSANYPVKNVLTLGVQNTGGDQGEAIQALFDAAVNNDTFYFPKGNYGTSIQLKLPSDKLIRIIGDGPGATVFSALSDLRSIFLKEGSRIEGIEFRDFMIEGNIPSKAQIGITLRSGVETKIENVYIARTSEAGLAFGIPSAHDASRTYHQYQYVTYSGHIFRSLQNSNLNHTPVVGGDAWWADLETYDVSSNGLIYDTRMKSVTLRSANYPSQGMFGIHQYASANDNWIGNCIIANYAVANIFDEAGYTFYHKVYMNGSPLSSSAPYGIWSVTQFTSADADAGITVNESYFDGMGPTGGAGAAIRLDKSGNLITNSTFYRGSSATTNAGVEMKNGITRTSIVNNRFDNVVPTVFQSSGTYGAEYYFLGNVGGLSPGSTTNIINSIVTTTPAAAGLGNVTNDAQLKASQLVTSVGSPGLNTNVPSEKAVRDAIAASSSGLADPGSNGVVKRTSLNTTGVAAYGDIVGMFGSGSCSGYLKSDGTCSIITAGDVTGPASSTDGNLAQFDGTTGKLLKNGPAFGTFIGASTIPITDSNGVIQLFAQNKVNGFAIYQDTTSTARNPNVQVRNYANGTAGAPRNILRNSNGTFATDAAVAANQTLGYYSFQGYRGTGDADGATIHATADSLWTSTDQPTTLRFSLGGVGTSGTPVERMVLTSSGRLGLNVATPQARLDVRNAATGTAWLSNTNASASNQGAGIFLHSLDGAAMASGDRLGFFVFGGSLQAPTGADGDYVSSDIGYGAAISAYTDGAYSVGPPISIPAHIRFETAAAGAGGTRTEKMRVTSGGNIGIGTTAPENTLDINSATGANLQLTYNDNNGSAANKVNFAVSSSGDLTITPSGGDINLVGTLNNPSGVQTTSTTIDTAANQGATISSSGATSLMITNVVAGRYFDFKVTSSGGGAISISTLTPTWVTGTPASVTATKSSWFVCKGTGANTADCVAIKENF